VSIPGLEQRMIDAEKAFKLAEAEYHAALIAAYPINVGQRGWPQSGCEYEVTSLRVRYGTICVYGRKVLKSGRLHANEQEMWWV
jgi:hypothetical protein